MSNHLTKLIKEYPDKEWSTNLLSYNPNITWNFIKDNLDLLQWNWKWSNLYSDDDVPIWFFIVRNDKLDWYSLSSNKNVIVNSNLDKDWNWYRLAMNPNIT